MNHWQTTAKDKHDKKQRKRRPDWPAGRPKRKTKERQTIKQRRRRPDWPAGRPKRKFKEKQKKT